VVVKFERTWHEWHEDMEAPMQKYMASKEKKQLEIMLREAELCAKVSGHDCVVSFEGVCFEYDRIDSRIKPYIAFEKMECNAEVSRSISRSCFILYILLCYSVL
jgi:hypothetical protein